MNPGKVKLEWIENAPPKDRPLALLIPFFNENGKEFRNRLDYFNGLARDWKGEIDVILIDDGSTDNSLKEIKDYRASVTTHFYAASVFPNGNKVGAFFVTALSISHEFTILSDFDTDLEGVEQLEQTVNTLRADNSLMGCYFRMLPHEGTGNVFLFQQLEYSLHRSLYRLHRKEGIVRVMPGAGACYKRTLLISLLYQHSGLRSGEDRELTSMGLRDGYKVFYMNKVLALTRPPLTFRNLVRQRIRWNLGYLETFYKERAYYLDQIGRFSSLGLLTLSNIVMVLFMLLLPFIIILTSLLDFHILLFLLGGIYLGYIIWIISWMLVSPAESKEFAGKRLKAVLLFPLFVWGVECPAWMGALLNFKRKRIKRSIENLKQIEYVAQS
jgi:cellulose synthase/poly-beta-1,6-N-acetylglucosamine synthase-like glycosyltransferase